MIDRPRLIVLSACALALLACFAVACTGTKADPAKAQKLEEQGLASQVAGDAGQAQKLYQQALKLDATNKLALFNLGVIYQSQGDVARAETNYRLAIAVDPNFVSPLYNLAIIRTKAGDDAGAADLYRRVLAIDPTLSDARQNLNALPVVPPKPADAPATGVGKALGSPSTSSHGISTLSLLLILLAIGVGGSAAVLLVRFMLKRRSGAGPSKGPPSGPGASTADEARVKPAEASEANAALSTVLPDRLGGRQNLLVGSAIYLILLSLYLLTASGHFYSTDHVQVYETSKALADRGSFGFPPNRSFYQRHGQSVSISEPGQAVVTMPLYAVGSAVDAIASNKLRETFAGPAVGKKPGTVWGGTVTIFFVSLFNQLLTPLLCVVIYFICLSLGFSPKSSFLTSIVCGVATMVGVGAHEYFQHPLETLLLLLAILVLFRRRGNFTEGSLLLAGLFVALGILTRANLVIAVPVFAAYIFANSVRTSWRPGFTNWLLSLRSPEGDARRAVVVGVQEMAFFVAPVALGGICLVILDLMRFGQISRPHGPLQGSFAVHFMPVALYGFLLSPGRSIFLYSPPIIAGLACLRMLWRRLPLEGAVLAGVSVLYLLFYSTFSAWHGAGCWGPRYLTAISPLLVIPAAQLFETLKGRISMAFLTLIGVFVCLIGTVVNPVYAEQWRGLWGGGVNNPYLDNAYFWNPRISPPAIHTGDFLHGRHWDLWLQFVLHREGLVSFLIVLAVFSGIFACGVLALRASSLFAAFGDGEVRRQIPGRDGVIKVIQEI